MNKRTIPVLFLSALLLAACTTVYTGAVTITTVVDATMKAYADLYAKGLSSPAIDAKVDAAHLRYRQAASVAQKSLNAFKESGDNTAYVQAINATKEAAQGILDIIYPLLVPTKAQSLQNQLSATTKI